MRISDILLKQIGKERGIISWNRMKGMKKRNEKSST
jgi:hypothetical protein